MYASVVATPAYLLCLFPKLTQNKKCVILGKMIKAKQTRNLPKTPCSYREVLTSGMTKHALRQLMDQGAVEKLGRGIYQLTEQDGSSEENQYRVATIRCGLPSSLCLLTALAHYHVTDQIPKQTWVLVPAPKRIASKDLKLVRSRDPQWDIGIRKTKHYWITTLERTLVDCLVYKYLIGSQVALEAIKQAVAQKKVKLGALYDMAKKMGVEHRIRLYIEALAS